MFSHWCFCSVIDTIHVSPLCGVIAFLYECLAPAVVSLVCAFFSGMPT